MAILWNCGVSWEETRESQWFFFSFLVCAHVRIREGKIKIPVSVRMNVLIYIVSILLKTLAEAQCVLRLFCVIQGADPLGYTPVQIPEGWEAYLHSCHPSCNHSWVSNNHILTHSATNPAFYCHDVGFCT